MKPNSTAEVCPASQFYANALGAQPKNSPRTVESGLSSICWRGMGDAWLDPSLEAAHSFAAWGNVYASQSM